MAAEALQSQFLLYFLLIILIIFQKYKESYWPQNSERHCKYKNSVWSVFSFSFSFLLLSEIKMTIRRHILPFSVWLFPHECSYCCKYQTWSLRHQERCYIPLQHSSQSPDHELWPSPPTSPQVKIQERAGERYLSRFTNTFLSDQTLPSGKDVRLYI